ncbi:MAG: type II toxin-antitoxin system HicA family toxin [Dehalococcoidia bacterium]
MARLPSLSGREVIAVFGRDGWQVTRQRSSHVILTKWGTLANLSVPDHRQVRRGNSSKPH